MHPKRASLIKFGPWSIDNLPTFATHGDNARDGYRQPGVVVDNSLNIGLMFNSLKFL